MHTTFSKILVPMDGSELSKKALETAITMAKQDDRIQLDVITIVDITKYPSPRDRIDPLNDVLKNTAKEALQPIEEELNTLPNQTRTFVLDGNPATTIIRFIEDNNTDLVVMGSRGLSGVMEVFLGSVSHYVVQKAACPVLIVK